MPRAKHEITFMRNGIEVKRRVPSKAQREARMRKFRATIRARKKAKMAAAVHPKTLAKRGTEHIRHAANGHLKGAGRPRSRGDLSAALTYLKQGQKRLTQMIRRNDLDSPDPVHRCLLEALDELTLMQ